MADRKISDLTALTAPAAGDYLPIVDISEVAAASKNKRITIEELFRGVPLGTAAAPSIAIEGDENTGIYSPGADQLAISTNGTGRLFVDSVGNVGTNVTPFAYAANAKNLQISGTGYAALTFGTTDGGTGEKYWRWIARTAAPAKALVLQTLDDSGGGEVNAYTLARNGTAIDYHAWSAGGSERLRITSAGLVGLGTSTPLAKLQVATGTNDYTATANTLAVVGPDGTGLYIGTHYDGSGAGTDLVARGYSTTMGDFRFIAANGSYASPATRMVIDGSGRVGIGTTAPDNRLHVVSTSAGQPSARFTDGSNSTLLIGHAATNLAYLDAYTNLGFYISGSERARIDSSGRLLVGTSSGRDVAGVQASEQIETTAYLGLSVVNNTSDAGGANIALGKTRGTAIGGTTIVQNGDNLGTVNFCGADGTDLNSPGATIACDVDGTPGANDMPGRLVFSTTADGASSPTERMRISQAGHVHVANTTGDYNTVGITLFSNGQAQANASGVNPLNLNRKTNDGKIIDFYRDTNNPGGISVTTTATTYATSSDYRLKENVVPLTGAIDRVNDLQVHRFNFIADPDKTVDGFIAHEAQAVVPECATGAKDELDADGNPVMQGIDQSKLVPLLTAALQEAIAEIASLKDRVAALEGA